MASLDKMEEKNNPRYKYQKKYESNGRDYASEARQKSKSRYESLSDLQKKMFQGEGDKQLGDFDEAPGGGTPASENEKGRGSMGGNFEVAHSAEEAEQIRKNDPDARVRVMQPRDEDGKFTYNSANLKDRKYKYHGYGKWDAKGDIPADFPIRYDYDKMAQMFKEGTTFITRDESGKIKRFTLQTTLSAKELRNAITEYSNVKKSFASGLGSEEGLVERKGRMSKKQQEALGEGDFGVAYDDQIKNVTSEKTAEAIEKAKGTQSADDIMESVKSVYNNMTSGELNKEKERLQEAMQRRPELKEGFQEQLKLVEQALGGETLKKEKGAQSMDKGMRVFDEYKTKEVIGSEGEKIKTPQGMRSQLEQEKRERPKYTEESVEELEKEIERTQDPQEKERLTNMLNTLKEKGGEGITTEESDTLREIRKEYKDQYRNANARERKNLESNQNNVDDLGNILETIKNLRGQEDVLGKTATIKGKETLKKFRDSIVNKLREKGISLDKEEQKKKTTTYGFMMTLLGKVLEPNELQEFVENLKQDIDYSSLLSGQEKRGYAKSGQYTKEAKEARSNLKSANDEIKQKEKENKESINKLLSSLNLGENDVEETPSEEKEERQDKDIAKSMGLEKEDIKKEPYEELMDRIKYSKNPEITLNRIKREAKNNPLEFMRMVKQIDKKLQGNEKAYEDFRMGWGKDLYDYYKKVVQQYNKWKSQQNEKVGA